MTLIGREIRFSQKIRYRSIYVAKRPVYTFGYVRRGIRDRTPIPAHGRAAVARSPLPPPHENIEFITEILLFPKTIIENLRFSVFLAIGAVEIGEPPSNI